MRLDVFFYEAFEEEQLALKRFLPAHVDAGFSRQTIQEVGESTPRARFISIRTQSIIPLSWAFDVEGILSRSTGYDHIEAFWERAGRRTPCGYLPLYCNRSVAEQAMLIWMSLLRKFPKQTEHFSRFDRDGLTGLECASKTLLVVGVGHIGFEVVKIGCGLGMQVLGVDIVQKHDSVTYVSIEEGLDAADVIVCAMNLTSANRGYFHYRLLKQAKRGAFFVNVARGELSASADLLRLLDENHLGGVGLDVYENESALAVSLRTAHSVDEEEVRATLELAKHSNVVCTPHNAFNTLEALERKTDHSVQQIIHFLEHDRFLWPVPSSSESMSPINFEKNHKFD